MSNDLEALAALNTALAQAQGEMPLIPKDKTAVVKHKSGGQHSYNYADLATILNTVRPILMKNGLSISQTTDAPADSKTPILITRLSHAKGAFIEGRFPLPLGSSPQETGSSFTYYRRYTLTAILGIATEDDDDGQSAAAGSDRGSNRPEMNPKQPPAGNAKLPMPNSNERGELIKELMDLYRPYLAQFPQETMKDLCQRVARVDEVKLMTLEQIKSLRNLMKSKVAAVSGGGTEAPPSREPGSDDDVDMQKKSPAKNTADVEKQLIAQLQKQILQVGKEKGLGPKDINAAIAALFKKQSSQATAKELKEFLDEHLAKHPSPQK